MSIKIAITNEKGGCGKTTTAVNVSAILAGRGNRVLLVDADPQSYSTFYYKLYDAEKPSLYEVMFEGAEPSSAIAKTKYFALDVLRASKRMMQAEENLIERKVSGKPVNTIMAEALASLDTQYEYIILDCPPQGSKLLDNVHCYADYILMPMIPDEFALHSLRIKAENLIALRKDLNPHIQLLGDLIVMDESNGTKAWRSRKYGKSKQYADPKYGHRTMRLLRECLEAGQDISKIKNMSKKEIRAYLQAHQKKVEKTASEERRKKMESSSAPDASDIAEPGSDSGNSTAKTGA